MLGIFDSGLGGLTILREIHTLLPEFSTAYLGDQARLPYGTRDPETIYEWTWQGVRWLLEAQGCPLVIVACNTASACALRKIQQERLPREFSDRRVLGIIRPTVEALASQTSSGHIGVLATPATVASHAFRSELANVAPNIRVTEVAAPNLASNVERGAKTSKDVQIACSELLTQDPAIDCILLGCTHYPLIEDEFRRALSSSIRLVTQGGIVAPKLQDYLARHLEIAERIEKKRERRYYTTGDLPPDGGFSVISL